MPSLHHLQQEQFLPRLCFQLPAQTTAQSLAVWLLRSRAKQSLRLLVQARALSLVEMLVHPLLVKLVWTLVQPLLVALVWTTVQLLLP